MGNFSCCKYTQHPAVCWDQGSTTIWCDSIVKMFSTHILTFLTVLLNSNVSILICVPSL